MTRDIGSPPLLPHQVLTDTIDLLGLATTLEDVTGVVTRAVRDLVGADGATFVLREDDVCHYADENAIGPLWKGLRFPMSACISGWAMTYRQTVVIEDISVDPRIPYDAYVSTFVTSLAMTPIRVADPVGALGAYWASTHVPTSEQVRMLEILANSSAVAIENLELRGAVERRVEERDALAQRAHELEEACHTIAHDLRSPLGAIVGYAELIAEGGGSDEQAVAFAETIARSGRRMAEQIERMLGLYRITRRPVEPAPHDLSVAAREIADGLVSAHPARSLRFDVADGLVVLADPVLTKLLLENLFSNAVKYSARRTLAEISLREVGTEGGFTTYVVSDNGAGFPSERADQLFRPMTRLHAETDFAGTGLGLASVARIVELHGGQVHAEGEESVGASFYFSLPVA